MEKRCHQNQDCTKAGKTIFDSFLHWILNRNKLPPKPRSCQKLAKTIFEYFWRLNFEYLNQVITWRIPNLTQKGGSKYRVHQGYGYIWKTYRFYIFCFLVELYLQMSKVMHPVSSESDGQAQIWYKREVLSIGFTKGMAAFGGGILFCIFCNFFAEKYCNQNQDLIFFNWNFE